MKIWKRSSNSRSIAAGVLPALLAAGVTCALSADALSQTLNYSQSAGFYSGTSASGLVDVATVCVFATPPLFAETCPANGPLAGYGGLDFFTPVPNTPNVGKTYAGVAWGCVASASTPPPDCANGGAVGFGFPLTPLPTGDGRSSLEVVGKSGTLDTSTWQPVTVVTHHNHRIDGRSNILDGVDVSSFLRIGNPTPTFAVDGPGGSVTSVLFTETLNRINGVPVSPCQPTPFGAGAPVNPLGGAENPVNPCDDFAIVSGLDLTALFIPAGAVGNPTALQINFRLTPTSPGALVCGQQAPHPLPMACSPYDGTDLLIYTREDGDNTFQIEAQLSPVITVALFVIGDCDVPGKLKKGQVPPPDDNLKSVGEEVNFWGSQWWKNNCMSSFTSNGYPAFKGYATNSVIDSDGKPNCGQWQARPGNSGNPPDTIPDVVNIIVTDNVIKDGPNIGGNIKQLVQVQRSLSGNDNYAGNPGHQGWGKITQILCTTTP